VVSCGASRSVWSVCDEVGSFLFIIYYLIMIMICCSSSNSAGFVCTTLLFSFLICVILSCIVLLLFVHPKIKKLKCARAYNHFIYVMKALILPFFFFFFFFFFNGRLIGSSRTTKLSILLFLLH
jgi:hypothetical protein